MRREIAGALILGVQSAVIILDGGAFNDAMAQLFSFTR
jgi:hypothetical protein